MRQMDRRRFLKALGAGAAMAAFPGAPGTDAAEDRRPGGRPNVVFIYTDDQDLAEVGCYGGDVLSPHTDSLARDGVMFSRFYVSSAVCSPSRYSALTGRYASRSKRLQRKFPPAGPVNIGWEPGVFGEGGTLAHALQRGGYRTGMVGKWHQGYRGPAARIPRDADPADPEIDGILKENYRNLVDSIKSCGFDYVASAYHANTDDAQNREGPWVTPQALWHHNMEWVTQGAVQFIEQCKDEPFFLYMATTLTHSPNPVRSLRTDPRSTWAGLLDDAPDVQPPRQSVLDRTREAGAAPRHAGVTWLDDGIGAVLKKVEELGLTEQTVVIFASDNGNKAKFTCYEAGARMPLIVRWPGTIPPGTVCDELASNVDLAPTILDICGVTPPPDMHTDGRSILPALKGDTGYRRESIYLEITTERAVVTDDHFKYIAVRYPPEIQKRVDRGEKYTHWCLKYGEHHHTYNAEKRYPGYFDLDQLYHLRQDPGEQRNLADDLRYRGKLEEMKALLKQYCRDLPHTYGEFKTA